MPARDVPREQAPTSIKPTRLREDTRGALNRVAHDIRSATGVAWTALAEIERATGRDDGQPSSVESYVRISQRSLRRLLFLADRLTLAGTLEQGELELASAQANVAELVAAVVKDVSFALGRRAVTVTVEPIDASLLVMADGRWLAAALSELVGNAIRFAKSKATIRAAVSDQGNSVTIEIEDDGLGIADSARATLADGAPTPVGSHGLGLSLPLANRVITAHLGKIRVDARESGKGTLIFVDLPRSERSSQT